MVASPNAIPHGSENSEGPNSPQFPVLMEPSNIFEMIIGLIFNPARMRRTDAHVAGITANQIGTRFPPK